MTQLTLLFARIGPGRCTPQPPNMAQSPLILLLLPPTTGSLNAAGAGNAAYAPPRQASDILVSPYFWLRISAERGRRAPSAGSCGQLFESFGVPLT